MKYIGSKNRLSKELTPIIQSYITESTSGYLEPFVGGANMIDKIKHHNKIGIDIHEELIELLKYAQNLENEFPQHISEEEYNKIKNNRLDYPKWYVGFVGFMAGFGAKYFGGYARGFKEDKVTIRDIPNESIRNLEKQRCSLQGIKFKCLNFKDIPVNKLQNYIIYCDIPYKNTTKYSTESFPYDDFYDWCINVSKNNKVLISEYWMPEDKFTCIWQKDVKVGIDLKEHSKRTEKLFTVKE